MIGEKVSLIFPVIKSPWPSGRICLKDKQHWQDWYRGLKKAVELSKQIHNSRILLLSGFQKEGEESEVDIYLSALKKMGFDESRILVVREGRETIEQVERAVDIAEEKKANLITVSTFLHAPRVAWLLRNKHIEQHAAFGIPRPREALTDIVLMGLFPLLDTVGFRFLFQRKLVERRTDGKF